MPQLLKRFARAQQGVAIVEFGLMLPVLMTLLYGAIEITRYILIVQKTEKLAHAVADMGAQSQTATRATLDQVMAAASDIMNPYSLNTNGTIYITSIYRAAGVASATVNWRYQGGGSLTASSQLGTLGGTASMPAGFTFEERENVIAAEVYFRFSPLVSSQFFGTTTVYRVAFYKPRFGALLNAPT
ncbi:MAG: TadE/TadG family type IV pilus assembly protein [Rickettsiales bacterium]